MGSESQDPVLPRRSGGSKPERSDMRETQQNPSASQEAFEQLGATRILPADASQKILNESVAFEDMGKTPISGERTSRHHIADYELVRPLGEGAMGRVYLAKHRESGREVALKLLFPHIAKNPRLVERLYQEGLVMGQLDHANIVQAYGVGEDKGWHYAALEYIDGESLQNWLDRRGKLPVADALHIAIATARALEYAHALGLVHRDIKPDNILINKAGVVKVADLGMVKSLDDPAMNLTQTGFAVGTPWYMPLEQAKNAKEIDGRSDIYALGCMLYCMLAGHPPFNAQSMVEVLQQKEQGVFPPARSKNPRVSERLDLIIAKMTAKLPKHRYQNCSELLKDLDSLGLAGPKLTFLTAPTPDQLTTPAPSEMGETVVSRDTERLDLWFVRVKDPNGQSSVQKLTTSDVLKMVETGVIKGSAQASRRSSERYRSLASYKEFETVLARTTKDAADNQNPKLRSQMKKNLEEPATRREDRNSARNEVEPTPSWHLWLAAALGLAAAAILVYFILG